MRKIITKIIENWKSDEDVMLISIIGHSGSTPRGRGAQMLVGREGILAGTIGGGAIEKEAVDVAVASLGKKQSFCRHCELNLQNGSLNMVCGGAVDLHFLYMDKAKFEAPIEAIDGCIKNEEAGYMIIDTVANTLTCGKAAVDTNEIISVAIPVPERVVIFGGGHVAQALVPVISSVGFSPIVVESREAFANKGNFDKASDVILCDYEKIADYITLNSDDYMVIMTHGHAHDYTVLEQLLRKEYAYIGVMGSKRKTAAVNEKLRAAGISEEKIKSVYTPIGLPIGAVTPEEIAISVTAELIRVRAIRRGQTGEKVCPSTL